MAKNNPITENIKEKEKILKALANRRRLAILAMLAKKGEMSVTEIAEALDLSIWATSKHLRIFRTVGLVDFQQTNSVIKYHLSSHLPSIVKESIKNL